MRPPKNAKFPPISLIFRWHESNRPDVVVVAGVVGPIMCAGDRNILTRPLRLSIFGNVLTEFLSLLKFSSFSFTRNSFQVKYLKYFFHFLFANIFSIFFLFNCFGGILFTLQQVSTDLKHHHHVVSASKLLNTLKKENEKLNKLPRIFFSFRSPKKCIPKTCFTFYTRTRHLFFFLSSYWQSIYFFSAIRETNLF